MHSLGSAVYALIRSAARWSGLDLAALAAALMLFGSGGTAAAARFDFDATAGRLPKDVVPTHYALKLELDLARETFDGRAEIDVTIRRATSSIVLQD
jgi:aminopeptidase N